MTAAPLSGAGDEGIREKRRDEPSANRRDYFPV